MPADSPENKCPGPESQVAVHPVWGCDDEAIKDEFRRLQAERDKYLEWFQKADAELERLHFENEQRESGRSPVDSGTGTRASVPSSPHETGLTAEQKARIEGLDSFGFVEWGDSDEAYLEALTNSGAGSRSDSEGEGLAARVERLAERMTGLARKQADEFGNYVSQGQFSADYKEGLASAYDDSAEALRSLLVPKEEA